MAKLEHEDSPTTDKPASPDHLAGREGAAPSSSGDGPSGKRGAAGGAAPRAICFKCADLPSMPGYRVCAYCFEVPPSHADEDESFDCGCAWNDDRDARPPSKDCVACRGSGRIRDKHHYVQIRRGGPRHRFGEKSDRDDRDRGGVAARHGHTAQKLEDPAGEGFLTEGGWHVEKAGSTGQPVGAPVRGVRGADAIWQQLERTLTEFEDLFELHLVDTQSLGTKAYMREFEALLVALSGDRLNDAATAAALDFSRQTFGNRDKLGRKTFAGLIEYVEKVALGQLVQKAPKGGRGDSMNAQTPSEPPTIVERIAEYEYRLAEVERQVGLPPGGGKAAEEAVDRFLEETLD